MFIVELPDPVREAMTHVPNTRSAIQIGEDPGLVKIIFNGKWLNYNVLKVFN